ncbi:hypothetical protein TWF481_012254 [Arthrobotrys musiformis]|uniref:Complex 1 LYR protein domain-containing protein n=1 Tax=Arthrobotrys musiformis TaxID=47236 RepID=A0AAV9VWM7_9PEZI
MSRHTGLQREVLSLYRSCLRAVYRKPIDSRTHFKSFVAREFRKHATEVDRKDFDTVEFLLRKGKRQLEVYGDPNIKRMTTAAG